jgi:PAS domain S-box-containing protein
MLEAPIPADEAERLAALRSLKLLDTKPQERFDRITRIATRLFSVPISTLTLIDSDREWFLSLQGVAEREGPRARSFCGHALLASDVFIIPDTIKDERFRDNPMVAGPPHIRFYAGRTLYSADGKRIGVFCIRDTKPRTLTLEETQMLRDLSIWAETEVNLHEFRKSIDNLDLYKVEENQRRFLQTLIEAAPVGLFSVGRDGKFETVNPTALKLLGIESESHIKGRDVFEFFPGKNDWLAKMVRQGLEGKPFTTELDSILVGLPKGWYRISGRPVLGPSGGTPERLLVVIEDLAKC